MKILIVIPCYNEEEVLPKTLDVLGALIRKIKKETDADTELLLVDDGSRDHTWQMISDAAKEHGMCMASNCRITGAIRMRFGQVWKLR